jgi:septal ring factor EnvC (AmiA/AmiB activator)
MKSELLSLVLLSGLITPQGLLWAADNAGAVSLPPMTNDLSQVKQNITTKATPNVKPNEMQLSGLNARIKSLEDQIIDTRAQLADATKAGDQTKVDALKDQINSSRKELREALSERHNKRMAIHLAMVDRPLSSIRELHHTQIHGRRS